MRNFFSSLTASFRHAFRGWQHVFRTQKNARIHSAIAIVVFVLGLWLHLPLRDWAVIILTTAVVFGAEFMNTAIETVVDLASPQPHPLAKIGKDVAAAAVLVAALAAILIGMLLIGPPLWAKLTFLFSTS